MSILQVFKGFGKGANHDRMAYYEYQAKIGGYYLHHFVKPFAKGKRVLDIGCGEGGVLAPFESEGYDCTGLEYSPNRIQFAEEKNASHIKFIEGNIEEYSSDEKFDVILILDVIEHLNNKLHALKNIRQMLASDGILVVSFPPFRSAFGGHQQVMNSFLKYIPYFHLFPEAIYKWILEKVEHKNIELHLHNHRTGITIRQFEKMISQVGFSIIKKSFYFVRPRQAFRFDVSIRKNRTTLFREFLTAGATYILQ